MRLEQEAFRQFPRRDRRPLGHGEVDHAIGDCAELLAQFAVEAAGDGEEG